MQVLVFRPDVFNPFGMKVFIPITGITMLGLSRYAQGLGRSRGWCLLAILNPPGPILALLWLHPRFQTPTLKRYLLILFALWLGFDWAFMRGEYRVLTAEDLTMFSLMGTVLGILDSPRSTLWGGVLVLPMLLRELLTGVAGLPSNSLGLGTDEMFFLTIHAMFGANFGGEIRWLITHWKRGDEDSVYPLKTVSLALLAASFVIGIDPLVSTIFGGSIRLGTVWMSTIAVLIVFLFPGYFIGRFLLNRFVCQTVKGTFALTDRSSILQTSLWGSALALTTSRWAAFETCFSLTSGKVPSCFTFADWVAAGCLGIIAGVFIALLINAAYHDRVAEKAMTLELSPMGWTARTLAIVTIAFVVIGMNSASVNNLTEIKTSITPSVIYMVPIGTFPEDTIVNLVRHYNSIQSIPVRTLPSLPVERWTLDYRREQLVGESLINQIRIRHRDISKDPSAMVFGFIDNDLASCSVIAYQSTHCQLTSEFTPEVTVGKRFTIISTHRFADTMDQNRHTHHDVEIDIRKLIDPLISAAAQKSAGAVDFRQ